MDTITAPPEEKTAKPKAGRDRSGSKRRTKAPRTKKIKASAEELLNYYRRMLLIRRLEEKAGQLYGMGLIAGFCHLYIGEEAVVVGMQAAMTPDDTMITAYRDHGHALACGMDPRGVMAELMGRAGGYSGGKGGSMHIFSAKDNFYGGHGIVGATVPLGTGLAFAHRYRGTPNVSLTFYGDGAANQGQVYEALNMAALWKLPVVYIIENNRYGMGTSVDRATANSDFYRRGELFGIPGKRVDGMDVLAVKAAGEIAVARCRAGKGPYILEMETYRYRGHSMSDPARYRTRDELNKVRDEHDAIDRLGQLLIDGGYADERQLRDIDKGVKKTVTEAVEHATNDPEPDASELYTDVLAALETFTPSQPKAAARVAPVDGEAAPPNGKTYGDTVTLTVREALRDAMAEEMRRDDSVFLIGEEVGEYQGAYKVSQGLLDEFGTSRVIDTPITEQGFTGLGVGAAFAGLRPIVEFMTFNFAMQAMDQMVNSAAKTHYMSGGQMQCSLVFRGPNGAASRVGAQHSQCFASWFAHVPGFKVIAPYAADDAKGLLKSAIRDPNPVVFLENEMLYGRKFEVPDDPDFIVPIGQARVARPGTDVTITAFSLMVAHALDAAETLAAEGIDAEIIDLRTLRPLDITTIVASVQKTHRLVAVEEGWPYAGIAAEIAAMVMEHAFDQLDAPPARVTSADVPMAYAANLEALALPRPEDIVAAVKEVCYRA